jgi:transcriptional regulator with XRE-family HTH domain
MGQTTSAIGYEKWLAGLRGRLKAVRESRGLSYRTAAERTGIPYASIHRVEAGRVDPTLPLLFALATGYGVALGQILGGDEAAAALPPAKRRKK